MKPAITNAAGITGMDAAALVVSGTGETIGIVAGRLLPGNVTTGKSMLEFNTAVSF